MINHLKWSWFDRKDGTVFLATTGLDVANGTCFASFSFAVELIRNEY